MKTIYAVIYYIRSWIAFIILKFILGWRLKEDCSAYNTYKAGRFVAIYLHTSLYDHLIGVLFSYTLQLPIITIGAYRSNKDTQTTGIRYLFYNIFDTIIIDPHKDRKTTCESIITDLEGRENFIFSIYPEGSIYRTSGLKSGFYKIAKNLKTDILLFDLNYHTHEVDLRKIIDSNIVLTAPYSRIVEITGDEMISGVPFDSTRTYLLNAVHRSKSSEKLSLDSSTEFELFSNRSNETYSSRTTNKTENESKNGSRNGSRNGSGTESEESSSEKIAGKPTSLININRSWWRFVPLTVVAVIGVSIVINIIIPLIQNYLFG